MGDSYLGVISIFQLLRNKGLISNQEYQKCIEEIYKSWDVEKERLENKAANGDYKS